MSLAAGVVPSNRSLERFLITFRKVAYRDSGLVLI
jgi:hypothetical protein